MAIPARGYLLECYWPGVTEDTVLETAERARIAVDELRSQGREVSMREAILVCSDEVVFCLFEGAEEDVRSAGEAAGFPFERVLEARFGVAVNNDGGKG